MMSVLACENGGANAHDGNSLGTVQMESVI